jgi:PAS domain S-box-containing protein
LTKKKAQLPNPLYALIEHSLDLIAVVDEHGTINFQSPSIERILGYSPQELIGKNAFEFIHPEDRTRVRAEFERARRVPGPTLFVEYRFLHKNESWRVLESVGSVFTTADGGEVGIVNSRDITDHRALQEQFRHAQRIATLGRLASSIVHEFQNALQVMVGNLDFILESNAPSTILPELEGIKKAGDIAMALARQLLNLASTTISSPQRLDAHTTIASLSTMLRHVVGRQIKIETSLNAGDATILARFGVLDQILVNLVTNAFALRVSRAHHKGHNGHNGPISKSLCVLRVHCGDYVVLKNASRVPSRPGRNVL